MDAIGIGNQAGGFLGGLLNPVLGSKTEQVVSTKPSASSTNTTIIGIIAIACVIAVLAYMIFKKSN